jgi:DNA-binding SARP family transcriptional activator
MSDVPPPPPRPLSGAWRLRLAQAPQLQVGQDTAVPLAPLDGVLLAWLALEGATPRARMAQLLWPDSADATARNSLRQRLFKLRRLAGGDLVAGAAVLGLAPGLQHDLADAPSVLADQALTLGPELDRWLQQQREQRRSQARQGLIDRCSAAERQGDWQAALAHTQALLALDPLSEDAHRRLIRTHYLAGDRAAALLAFDRCEQLLKDEVGVRPSSETLALLSTVEQAAPSAALSPAPWRVPASVQRPPRLIGRDAPWAALTQAWDAQRVVLVSGEGGLGKTRLVTDFAQSRGAVALASARPGDAGVAYASFSRWLRALPRPLLADQPPAVQRELARLLPELGEAPPPQGAGQERTRLFNAVATLVEQAAQALHGAVFDDLHFADDASVELLQFVLSAVRWRWLVTARAGEVSAAGGVLLQALAVRADGLVLPLAPLGLAQVAELVDSLGLVGLVGADSAPALLRHSGGNPLYLLETLKTWLSQGAQDLPARLPAVPNLQALIERRITRLSVPAVQLARCAAVAAPDFSIELAAHVLGQRTIELSDPWAELEAAQVLTGGAFVHDLIFEAALASVPAVVARQLHAEIAAFLSTRGGEPLRLARHWRQAERWDAAGQAFVDAARRAGEAARVFEQTALLAEAAEAFNLAGLPAQRFDALLQRARCLADNHASPEAQAAVAQLSELARSDEQRLQALDARAVLAINRTQTEETLRCGREALEAARAWGRVDLEPRFAGYVADALCDLRRAAEAVALLQPYAAWVREHADADTQWRYWCDVGLALDYANRLRDALQAWDEALAVAHRSGHRDRIWKAMSSAASTRAKMGQVQWAAEVGERVNQLALAADEGITLRVRSGQVIFAHRLRDLGRYSEALPLLEAALQHFSREASEAEVASAEHRLSQLYQWLGQPGRAVPLLSTERTGLAPGLAMMRLVHRADLAHQLGRDGLPQMREALQVIDNPDDIYHRIASLFATRLVPPDEGEAMATSLAAWASARERLGVALAGHVRAAACALAQGAARRAWPHVEAALHLQQDHQPDSFYIAELWLVAAQTHAALKHPKDAHIQCQVGLAWVQRVAAQQVPPEFVDSFLQRNPVNRELQRLDGLFAS